LRGWRASDRRERPRGTGVPRRQSDSQSIVHALDARFHPPFAERKEGRKEGEDRGKGVRGDRGGY